MVYHLVKKKGQKPMFLASDLVFQMVRARGLEPPWGCPHTDLNRTRLPIPPRPHNKGFLSKRVNMIPEFMDRDKEKLHVL